MLTTNLPNKPKKSIDAVNVAYDNEEHQILMDEEEALVNI
jgi:hypothetical protein